MQAHFTNHNYISSFAQDAITLHPLSTLPSKGTRSKTTKPVCAYLIGPISSTKQEHAEVTLHQ